MILKRNKSDDKFLRLKNLEELSLRKIRTPLCYLFFFEKILILYKTCKNFAVKTYCIANIPHQVPRLKLPLNFTKQKCIIRKKLHPFFR